MPDARRARFQIGGTFGGGGREGGEGRLRRGRERDRRRRRGRGEIENRGVVALLGVAF